MKLGFAFAFGLTACVAGLNGSSHTRGGGGGPMGGGGGGGGGGEAPASNGEYRGEDAVWVVDVSHNRRAAAQELIHAKGANINIVETGDLDPAHEHDEVVCAQTPSAGKIAPNGTITLKYCNTYQEMSGPPDLRGLTVEAAKKAAVAAGYTHDFEVTQLGEYNPDCKADTVCYVTPIHWETNSQRMMIFINKKLAISVPD